MQTPNTPQDVRPVLANIARFHREHERFHAQLMLEGAASLMLDANRLRTLAHLWRAGGRAIGTRADADYADATLRAAGCEDLSDWACVATLGVLHMEGEGEPAEITLLKRKLRGLAESLKGAGQWLGAKAMAARERESTPGVSLPQEAIDRRLFTVQTNARVSQGLVETGEQLTRALDLLDSIDFRPAALRADRERSAQRLDDAARHIMGAAQVRARGGADLADNDEAWAVYLAALTPSS